MLSHFVKIPKQLFTISPGDARLYAAFLDFKVFNSEGFICPPFKVKENRYYYRYWFKKLILRGWANVHGHCFSLSTYQEVWRLLGVDQSWNNVIKKLRFTYHKVDIERLPENRKEYFKQLTELILTKVAGNRVRQIKWRLKNKHTPDQVKQTETFISCRKVAKLFGLKSPSSGSKYRKMFFDVVNEPTVLRKTPEGYRFKCKRISL